MMASSGKKLIGYVGGDDDADDVNLSDALLNLLGPHAFLSLVEAVGGIRFYVPVRERDGYQASTQFRKFEKLTELFGVNAESVAVEMDGVTLVVPSHNIIRALELHSEGVPMPRIYVETGIRSTTINRYIKQGKIKKLMSLVDSRTIRSLAREHAGARIVIRSPPGERAANIDYGNDPYGIPIQAYGKADNMFPLVLNCIGTKAMDKLLENYSGSFIRIPLAREFRAKRYRFEGLSNRQIARRLGITETGVDKLFRRARNSERGTVKGSDE